MDNGPEFIAWTLRHWCRSAATATAYIEPGSPWENPFVESFNGRTRDELLNIEEFGSLLEAQVVVETWAIEWAHGLLHGPGQDPIARNRAEVEAESVAYVVCQAAGMATTDYSLPYVARWARGDIDVVRSTADRVLRAARHIIDGLGHSAA